MTIQLLTEYSYGKFEIPPGAVVGVFDAATETGLIAAKLAVASVAAVTWTPPAEVPVADTLSSAEIIALKAQLLPFGTVTISTGAGQTLKSGPGYLKSFTVLAKGTGPTMSGWDNTANSGTPLFPNLGVAAVGLFPALDIGQSYTWDEPLYFANGAHIVIGGTGTTTVAFQVR